MDRDVWIVMYAHNCILGNYTFIDTSERNGLICCAQKARYWN